jgi:hypothetical protein
MVKMSSGPFAAETSGLLIGDGIIGRRLPFLPTCCPRLLITKGSTGDNAGDLIFHRHGWRTLGAGISCIASHSLCSSNARFAKSWLRGTRSFFNCALSMYLVRSANVSSSMSSNNPDSSIVSSEAVM